MRISKCTAGLVRRFAARRSFRVLGVLAALGLLSMLHALPAGAVADSPRWPAVPTGKAPVFMAGAYAVDVTPTNLPVIVNGGFLSQTADKVHHRLHARWLVLDNGRTRVALGVLDTCVIPGEFADAVRLRAEKVTGI